jgi:hypothetical protein
VARDNAFVRGLRELGYVEGKNIVIERRFAEGKFERLAELAAELVALKVDVIVSVVTASVSGSQGCDRDDPDRHGGRFGSRWVRARRKPCATRRVPRAMGAHMWLKESFTPAVVEFQRPGMDRRHLSRSNRFLRGH